MPKKKVRVTELPDKEAIRKLFPEKVVRELDRVAHEKDDLPTLPDKSPRR